MVQEKMPEAGAAADLLVLLLIKASVNGAAYSPLALLPLEDLPEYLRSQIAVGGARGAAAGSGGIEAPAPAPLRGEGAPVRCLPVHTGHLVVPDVVRRKIAGELSPPNDLAGYFAVGHSSYGAIGDNSELRALREEGGSVVYQLLDATPIHLVPGNMDSGPLKLWNGLPASVERSGAAVFACELGTPFFGEAPLGESRAAGLRLGALDPDGLVPVAVGHNALHFGQAFLGNNRAAEQGAVYSGGIVPTPENIAATGEAYAAARFSPHAVQVCVEAAVGAEAGDPIAVRIKAAGGDAGRERRHRGGNLSAVVGVLVASSAVTAVTAGAVSPAAAFGLFVILLGGLCLAMASVRAP